MKNKKKIILIVVISLVLTLLLSAGGYFTYKYFDLKNSKEETKTEIDNNQNQEQDVQENTNENEELKSYFKTEKGYMNGNQIVDSNGESFMYKMRSQDAEKIVAIGLIEIDNFELNGKQNKLELLFKNHQRLYLNKKEFAYSSNFSTPTSILTYKDFFLLEMSHPECGREYILFSSVVGRLASHIEAYQSSTINLENFKNGEYEIKSRLNRYTENGEDKIDITSETINLTDGYKSNIKTETLMCKEVLKDENNLGYCECGGTCQFVC